jgi:ParB family chromosome partitioning protein
MRKLRFEYLPLDKIDIGISNVRKSNLEEGLEDLAASIKEIGVQQPVVVFEKGDRYELIIGQRRYLACKKIGEKDIPALITSIKNDTDAIIKSFSENIHRVDLEYRDKMQVALELKNRLGSIEEVAKHLGVSSQTVRNYLGFSAVPEPIKIMVEKGELSASTAIRITKNIPDEKLAVKIAEKVKEIPRSANRSMVIDVAKENPHRSLKDIDKIAKERIRKITIHVTQEVYDAIISASAKYQSDKEDVVKEALEEWLKKRGFI